MERLREFRDLADSIRVEVGGFTPAQDLAVSNLVREYSQRIESRFGLFIPNKTKERVTTLPFGVFAVADPQRCNAVISGVSDFTLALLEWESSESKIESLGTTLHLYEQTLVFVKDIDSWWEDAPPQVQDELVRELGSVDEVKNRLGFLHLRNLYVTNLATPIMTRRYQRILKK